MTKEEFKIKFEEIVTGTENTHYGSIISEFRLLLLVQEFYLTNSFSREEIIEFYYSIMNYSQRSTNAQKQVISEIEKNLYYESHKATSVIDDMGKEYTEWLFERITYFRQDGTLFDKT